MFAYCCHLLRYGRVRNAALTRNRPHKFVDGTTNAIEVTDELYLIHLQLVQMEKRNHWRETRRHTSLNYLIENGIDFEDKSAGQAARVLPCLL